MSISAARAVEFGACVGENALPIFIGAQVFLFVIVGAGWLALHRYYIKRHLLPHSADARVLTAMLIFGASALGIAAALFATLPHWIVLDGALARADQALTDTIRHNVALPVLKIFAVVTVLADTTTLWLLAITGAAVLLWQRRYALALVWTAAIAGNGVLTRVLKTIFARARPAYEHELFSVQGWSFPSGHSSGAVAAYGALAYVLMRSTPMNWHLPIVLSATAIIFATGCSRIFLQVHYASDVLAGFAVGLAWLAVCVIAAEISRRASSRSNT